MKISFFDKFDNFRYFINIIKAILRDLDKKNLEVSTMVVYATIVNKNTKRMETPINEDGNTLGMEVGLFPFIDKRDVMEENSDRWWLVHYVAEDKMFNQSEYNKLCFEHKNVVKIKEFLPIMRHSKTGKTKEYKTVDEMKKDNLSLNHILEAIQNGEEYKKYTWTSESGEEVRT